MVCIVHSASLKNLALTKRILDSIFIWSNLCQFLLIHIIGHPKNKHNFCQEIFNRRSVAGVVLQTASSLMLNWFINFSCPSKFSGHHKSKTVQARELKFWENVWPLPCVTWRMSRVICQVSHVRCHVTGVFFVFICWQND